MKVIEEGRVYSLWQQGGATQILEFKKSHDWRALKLTIAVAWDRTDYLMKIRGCSETGDAITYARIGTEVCQSDRTAFCCVDDPGHLYNLDPEHFVTSQLRFVKSSNEMKQYLVEWPGIQTQELLRALISYSRDDEDVPFYLRRMLFMYEVRAYRRKRSGLNKKNPDHDDTEHPRGWRQFPFADVPFDEEGIELLPVGEDGHIIVPNYPQG